MIGVVQGAPCVPQHDIRRPSSVPVDFTACHAVMIEGGKQSARGRISNSRHGDTALGVERKIASLPEPGLNRTTGCHGPAA